MPTGLGSPPIYYAAKYMTENVFFKNPLIASGPCPACSAPNRLYFGDILGVEVSLATPTPCVAE